MAIERTTRTQFEALLAEAAEAADADIIMRVGPFYGTVTRPTATVASRLNERIRLVSQWLSLSDPDVFDGFPAILAAVLSNEEITLLEGSYPTVVLRYSMPVRPTQNLTVVRGSAVSGQSSGQRVIYRTTETRTLSAATASVGTDGRYFLDVPARAVAPGSGSVVAAGALRTIVGAVPEFDRVTNPAASTPAADAETPAEAIERYRLSVVGRAASSPRFVTRIIREEFPSISATRVIYGADLARAESVPGAVDAFVFDGATSSTSSTLAYLGLGQLHLLEASVAGTPLATVTSVRDVNNDVDLVEGVDYEVVFDAGLEGRSVYSRDGLRFLGTSVNLPEVNTPLLVTWDYDQSVRDIQARFDEEDLVAVRRSLLIKRGIDVPIAFEATVVVLIGFDVETVRTQAETRVLTYVAGLAPGAAVEEFDLEREIGAISGVDNVITTRLSRTTDTTGISDLAFDTFERATLDAADLILT